jgi:hypothetical protein
VIEDLEVDLDVEEAGPAQRKLRKAVVEFGGYIRANTNWIPNYGERHRCGEAISNAFVESAVNHGGEQADGQEAADALDATRRSSPPAGPHSAQRS